MNPGLLNLRVRLERQGVTKDALGQPVETWTSIRIVMARGMVPRDRGTVVAGDRETERRGKVFRVRSQPFLGLYRAGDRLVELARTDIPETVWKIEGWTEVEGTAGMYVDVAGVVPGE